MSQVIKYPTKKLGNFNELFAATSSGIMNIPNIIYSYLEDSIKECERIRRRSECEPLEFVNLTTQSPIPVQMHMFWACGKSKENFQLLSRQYFKTACKEKNWYIILSGYVTDEAGMQLCIDVNADRFTPRPDLDSVIEEADCWIIPHV